LKVKRRQNFTKRSLFLHDKFPAHRALAVRRNWPTWASIVLITHPILSIWPVGISPVPWTEETTEKSPFLVRHGGHCCHGDLVERTTF
jgi:hypothetical protein